MDTNLQETIEFEKGNIFPVFTDNIRISRDAFHIYAPMAWKMFSPINTVSGIIIKSRI